MTHLRRLLGLICMAVAALPAEGQSPTASPDPAAHGDRGGSVEFTAEEISRILQHSPLPAPPPDPTNRYADDPRAAHLGQFLFFDPRLSGSGQFSCATCHLPDQHFADGRQLGRAAGNVDRHTQALWNVAYNRWFFWDGRADTLWAQALEPIERVEEMAGTRTAAVGLIARDEALRSAYTAVFGPLPPELAAETLAAPARPVRGDARHPHHQAWETLPADQQTSVNRVFANIGKAIAAYERRLISRDAPFDRFVAGLKENDPARRAELSPAAQRGLKIFIGPGNCRLCHSGPNFSDGEFHNVRIAPLDGNEPRDSGRYGGIGLLRANPFNAAGEFSDDRTGPAAERLAHLARRGEHWGQFKTPSLRNAALTAPYMHQGQKAALRDVLRHYSTFEGALPEHHARDLTLVPLNLSDGQIEDLAAFLESLVDTRIDESLRTAPAAPSPAP